MFLKIFRNEENPVKNVCSLFIIQSFFTGIESSLNPFAMANIFLFFVFVCVVCNTKKKVLYSSLFLIFVTFFVHYFMPLGFLWKLSISKSFINIFRLFYLFIGLFFIWLGLLLFFDWLTEKKILVQKKIFIKFPAFLRTDEKYENINIIESYNSISTFFIVILVIIFGSFGAIAKSIWPEDYFYFYNIYMMFGQGLKSNALFALFLYSISFIFPLIITSILLIMISDSTNLSKKIINKASFIRIIFSSVFLSIGIGLFYSLSKVC